MSINLVAVCDKEVVAKQLEQTCDKLGYDITCEIQQENEIINKLSDEALDKSNAILLVTQIGWNYNDPETAVLGVGFHIFEWLFVRLSPIIFIGAIVGIFLTRKKV